MHVVIQYSQHLHTMLFKIGLIFTEGYLYGNILQNLEGSCTKNNLLRKEKKIQLEKIFEAIKKYPEV